MNENDSAAESSYVETYHRVERLLISRRDKCLQEYNQHMRA